MRTWAIRSNYAIRPFPRAIAGNPGAFQVLPLMLTGRAWQKALLLPARCMESAGCLPLC